MSLLEVQQLSVAFDGSHVVDNVSFTIEAGEKLALVGESGSGKTVTALSLLQLNQDATYQGKILYKGENILSKTPQQLQKLRGRDIAMIFQEPMTALNPLFTIGNQIAEVLTAHEGISGKEAAIRVVALLERTGLLEPAKKALMYPHQLSGGQRQRAMIAMALACKPKLLIADEPTTALDVTIQVQILALLEQLQKEDNMAVLMISHDLNLVKHFADRVGVMEHGQLIELKKTQALFDHPEQAYTKKLLSSHPERMVKHIHTDTPTLMTALQITCQYSRSKGLFRKEYVTVVDDVSCKIREGETLGIVGESGSGKTTLGMALLKMSSAKVSGKITFNHQDLDRITPGQLRHLRGQMQIVFQDPYSSLSPRMTIAQILEEGLSIHQSHLTASEKHKKMVQMLVEVGLDESMLSRYPHEFSGGQRQRIAIARAVIISPKLILLDEPTSALDVSVQHQVLHLLAKLQDKYGLSYILISHNLDVIRAMAHQVCVMQHGKVIERGEVTQIMSHPTHTYTQRLLAAASYQSTSWHLGF